MAETDNTVNPCPMLTETNAKKLFAKSRKFEYV
jgi:hypothetical protein